MFSEPYSWVFPKRVCKSDRMEGEKPLPSQPQHTTRSMQASNHTRDKKKDTASHTGGGIPDLCCVSTEVWLGSSPAKISSVFRSPQCLCPAVALMLSAQLWIRFQEMWAHSQGWNQTRRTDNDQPRVTAESHFSQPKHSWRRTREPLCSKSRFREFISHGRNMTNYRRP